MDTELEGKVGHELRKRSWKLGTAESCTGGLIAHRLTNLPGSSDYFLGGGFAYANEAKQRLLGVRRETLEQVGAVSREVVLEMAYGIRGALSGPAGLIYTVGLSVSGIAGPGGGTPNKPVGLVWIGLSTPEGDWAWENHFTGERIAIKEQAADQALRYLLENLTRNQFPTIHVQAKPDRAGAMEPVAFTWQGQTYQVSGTGRRWTDTQGEHIMALTFQNQTFELILAPDGTTWYLNPHSVPAHYA